MPDKPDDWERHAFQSSHLHYALYSPSRREMIMTFANGRSYSYAAGPDLWSSLKSSERPGRWFRSNVLGNFPGKELFSHRNPDTPNPRKEKRQ